MITEDYVSFETAKLLKENGFPLPSANFKDWVFCMYDENGGIQWGCYHPDYYARVTLQMAMKWLREVHSISIDICTVQGREVSYMFNIWDFSNIQDNKFIGGTFDLREQLYDFKTYEEAVESAIKYCLEKLI